ncbi:unnamed protein product [Rhodiola kirilowii]
MNEETTPSMSARVAESLAIERRISPNDKTRSLTIKTSVSGNTLAPSASMVLSSNLSSGKTNNSAQSSPYYSPLISPPSSAFVSALQSPYISPRATLLSNITAETKNQTSAADASLQASSNCGSQSEDIPSSSYTPPTDTYEYSDDPSDPKFKYMDCIQVPDSTVIPRVSFSFPVPRISFAKGSVSSPTANAKLRSCDVYIGFHGQNPNLGRFCKWIKSELEIQGMACFVADRAKYTDNQSHDIADRVICSVNYGIVVVTGSSLLNPFSIEEMRFFAQKKNLIPVFFDIDPSEITGLCNNNSVDKECSEAINALIKSHGHRLEAYEGNWRGCVSKAVGILRSKLGRKSIMEKEDEGYEELPFPRNRLFVGREKELLEMEASFFGGGECPDQDGSMPISKDASGQSEGLADEESDVGSTSGGYINLELGRDREPKLEAWVEPVLGRTSLRRPMYKKSKSGRYKCYGSNVICINGVAGIGKTDLALEFAYRYSQRYKMVLWVGGESRYFRQNLLNLSLNLGLDVSADTEKERGRIRNFEEQESEAFKRIKRELFRDLPYLLIIDNLDSESEWWEGKDLHDLIPRNTGGTHIIITTRLPKVMNVDVMQLTPLPLSEAMMLMRGRRKREYPEEELEFLRKFEDKLRRLTIGMWIVGSLISELAISPSGLFEAINRIPVEEGSFCSSIPDDLIWKNNPFLMKVLGFCMTILETNGNRNIVALRMVLVGAWFAPTSISANLLAAAVKSIAHTGNKFGSWTKYLNNLTVCYGSGCCSHQRWNTEEDSAMLLVKMGLARKANRKEPGCWINFHPITRAFAKRKNNSAFNKAAVQGLRKFGCTSSNFDHAWASAFLVFGFKSEPPLVQLKAIDMVLFIKKTSLPLAITSFATFSRCTSALELLKVCTNVLEEVEKSFVSHIQDWCHASLCWTQKLQTSKRVDEYLWQEVTLLKATLLETRAKLLLRGGHFDSDEVLCRTCISIRTVMLGHNHTQTLAAQETLAKIVRLRSKI